MGRLHGPDVDEDGSDGEGRDNDAEDRVFEADDVDDGVSVAVDDDSTLGAAESSGRPGRVATMLAVASKTRSAETWMARREGDDFRQVEQTLRPVLVA